MPFPSWSAAKASTSTADLNATNYSAQVDQLLGTHSVKPIYVGNKVATTLGAPQFSLLNFGNTKDLSAPFSLTSGTTVGRVVFPVSVVGEGADLTFSLYPDNGGVPNTSNLLAQTRVPASWLSALDSTSGLSTSGPLADPSAAGWGLSNLVETNYAIPANSTFGSIANPSTCQSGNFIIFAGGIAVSGPTAYTGSVFTSQWLGTGVMGPPIPGPTIPQGVAGGSIIATSSALVFVGGANSSTVFANVWVASWNPDTGEIGAWSAQTNLPAVRQNSGIIAYGDTVYVVGGLNGLTAASTVNTVYSATVSNGQINSWTVEPPLPISVSLPVPYALNGWFVSAGGQDAVPQARSNVYVSKINADGTLGPWSVGPTLQSSAEGFFGGTTASTDKSGMLVGATTTSVTGDTLLQSLGMFPEGVANQWVISRLVNPSGGTTPISTGAFPLGDGSWNVISISTDLYLLDSWIMTPFTLVSVPLPASGLTTSAKYHVVVKQNQSNSASDYVQYGFLAQEMSTDMFPPLSSPRNANTFTQIGGAISGTPMYVFDASATGDVLHLVEDPSSTGSAYSTNYYAKSSYLLMTGLNLPLGYFESTLISNNTFNVNPTFTSGVTDWTTHSCTFVQSNAQTHGGFAFSGLMTPDGVGTTPRVTSGLMPLVATDPLFSNAQWFQVNGWLYSPTGYGNLSLSVDWYSRTSAFISTSNKTTTIAAATWTNYNNFYQAPANAAFASINVLETGTPAVGNTLFLSNVTFQLAPEVVPSLNTVSQTTYDSTSFWVPTGVTQIA